MNKLNTLILAIFALCLTAASAGYPQFQYNHGVYYQGTTTLSIPKYGGGTWTAHYYLFTVGTAHGDCDIYHFMPGQTIPGNSMYNPTYNNLGSIVGKSLGQMKVLAGLSQWGGSENASYNWIVRSGGQGIHWQNWFNAHPSVTMANKAGGANKAAFFSANGALTWMGAITDWDSQDLPFKVSGASGYYPGTGNFNFVGWLFPWWGEVNG